MKAQLPLPILSLRTKLVLTYLGVALGAILMLAIVVSLAVQNYFDSTQKELLRENALYQAGQIEHLYSAEGDTWGNFSPGRVQNSDPVLLIITDTNAQQLLCSQPAFITLGSCSDDTLTQALAQALQGQEVIGHLQGTTDDASAFSGLYISLPLRLNGQPNGQIIGAMLLAQPEQYPEGFSPNAFLVDVNQSILIAGLAVALIVILFSMVLARRFIRPLESLTVAAEQMKQGDYAKRVNPPKSKDELERLAVAFNDMADTIESDVTELRRQEQLRRELLANMAHDLATPLTAIQGFSEALADDVISDREARQETAQLIGREVQRLRRLVGDMQQMTSLELGRVQLDLAPLDLHTLADETVAVIMPECEQAGITIHNEIAPSTPLVLADSDRITQVLLNLLDNARRHTPTGGRLILSATSQGNKVIVRVRDTGSGIAPDALPYIFERFYKADRARTGSASGSGLGLSIVKAIITAHGGTISAESAVAQGTEIAFSLPVA
jgi:two-component system, OmpR family, sensor histidine kinase BaeS